ncbi:hypothetical protein SISSUDRAFT_1065788 [Sistotremastrum suecicum HHB10207 ss-3]|uniref:DEAD/DEAH box helicase domain-containing protein n=1 Tax=Sistotremastrum suecicum HHB10207 ss-3 TaxID=1314776 RepID=A0A165Z304_9AGAM|nr:hypothetical protein SISSUDRAFT_1065788 [Sistotremastrum suecicum HHB10207 ss-3]
MHWDIEDKSRHVMKKPHLPLPPHILLPPPADASTSRVQASMPPKKASQASPAVTSPKKRRKRAGGQSAKRVTKTWQEDEWEALAKKLKTKFKLGFTPEEWQARTILSVLAGKDVIFVAGTGYGKSLVFEG